MVMVKLDHDIIVSSMFTESFLPLIAESGSTEFDMPRVIYPSAGCAFHTMCTKESKTGARQSS